MVRLLWLLWDNMKLFEITQTSEPQPQSAKAVVVEWMKKYKIGVKRYKINPDGTVDVTGDFDITKITDTKLPFKLNSVSGDIKCDTLTPTLTTVEGFPAEVGGGLSFGNCSKIDLTQLPRKIGGLLYLDRPHETFTKSNIEYCGSMLLSGYVASNLKGMPKYVEKGCSISNCMLDDLTGSPAHVGGNFGISSGKVKSLAGLSTYIGGNLTVWHGGYPEQLGNMGQIQGDISIDCSNTTDLSGLPTHVLGSLKLSKVKSLVGFPTKIAGNVDITLDPSVSISNLHKIFEMNGWLMLHDPVGRPLLSIPKIRGITSVKFTGYSGDGSIKKLEAAVNACIAKDIDIHELQDHLIDGGYYKEARL